VPTEHRYYPLFADLDGRTCVVVGESAVSAERAAGLLRAGAHARVIAPSPGPELLALLNSNRTIEHHARPFRDSVLDDAWLAFCERDDRELVAQVAAAAEQRRVLLNVQDLPEHCSMVAGAVVRRGDLTIAISTGGAAPALAVRLRERLERELGSEFGEFLALARRARVPLLHAVPDFEERRRRWYRLVDAPELLALLRDGETKAAQRLAEELLGLPAAALDAERS
jgi:siroheme synthase-like protein